MIKETENYIDHEVRVRLLEKICDKIDSRFQHIENKMDNQFKWTMDDWNYNHYFYWYDRDQTNIGKAKDG